MFNYIKSGIQDIRDAFEAWDNRKEKSINALGTTPLYDRYDEKYGLHSAPKVETDDETNDD